MKRSIKIKRHRIEIEMKGQPIYQFKIREVSSAGAEFLVKDDSNFLKLVELRQTVDIKWAFIRVDCRCCIQLIVLAQMK